jgi:aspartyl-tRNA(Asn)/glutamyl-tRNA(Gln) amidotransferase subunit A
MERTPITIDAVRAAHATAEGAVRAALDRAHARGPALGCFTEILDDHALARAKALDAMPASARGPLWGVPIAVKDNICTIAGRTSCGSRMLEHYRSPFDATVIERLHAAGAVMIAKTSMDEFAMGSSGENSAFGVTRNPVDPRRVPGGSSAGSAAAVAAGIVPVALGSDTGGSIRQPAAFTGTVGFKPTWGRVSRWGLVAYASSLDQIGPIATTVEDCARVYAAIAGMDPLDTTSADLAVGDPVGAAGAGSASMRGVRIGVPEEARSSANDPGVRAAFDAAIDRCRGMGAEIVEVRVPSLAHAIAAYYLIATAEASSNLARFDGIRYGRRAVLEKGEGLEDLYARSRGEGLGAEVRRRILLGTYVLSAGYYDAYYVTALKVRRLIKNDFDSAFNDVGCDVVMMPTAPTPAWEIGAMAGDPMTMYLQDIYTVPANLAGLPAISVPMGMDPLPMGLQFIAPAYGEERLLGVAGGVRGGKSGKLRAQS